MTNTVAKILQVTQLTVSGLSVAPLHVHFAVAGRDVVNAHEGGRRVGVQSSGCRRRRAFRRMI